MEKIVLFLQNNGLEDNNLAQILSFLGLVLAALLLKRYCAKALGWIFFSLIKKQSAGRQLQEFYQLIRKPLELLLLVALVGFAFRFLKFPSSWEMGTKNLLILRILLRGFRVLYIISLTWLGLRLIDFIGLVYRSRNVHEEDPTSYSLVPFLRELSKVCVILFSLLFTLGAVFKVEVITLLGGLGIGGLAFALAGKETLENLFASFTIFLDKPFLVGDLVKVGDTTGTVERVGFRSTRIRTLEKSFLTIPNKQMIDLPLDNLTKKTQFRVRFFLNLPFTIPSDKIEPLCEELKAMIKLHPNVVNETFVEFLEIGEASYKILVLYFFDKVDWDEVVPLRHEINVGIVHILEKYEVILVQPIPLLNHPA